MSKFFEFKYFILLYLCQLKGLIKCYDENFDASSTVNDIPRILTGNLNITTYVGDTVVLPCEVSHLGNYHVNWLRINNDVPSTLTVGYQQFSRNMRYRVARVHNQNPKNRVELWNFEIRKVTTDDQGLYECYIRLNSKQKLKAHINLEVKTQRDEPLEKNSQIDQSFFSNNYAADSLRSERLNSQLAERIDTLPNNWIKIRCNATGSIVFNKIGSNRLHNNYDIQWYKDGQLIEMDSRRLKKWVSSYDNSNYMELELYALDPEDSGVYQCKRDKTVLKNVVLQVVQNSGTKILIGNSVIISSIILAISIFFLF